MSPRASSPALNGNPARNSCPASPGTPEAPKEPKSHSWPAGLEHADRQCIVLDWRASRLGAAALRRAPVKSPRTPLTLVRANFQEALLKIRVLREWWAWQNGRR